ncbi:MAG: TlpA family protein disulfide reductase, partial [Planctomycetota bacterium]
PLLAQQKMAMDAKTLLRKAAATFTQRPPLSYHSEAVTTYPDRMGQPGKVTKLRYISIFRQDGERIDLTRSVLRTIDGEEKPFKISRQMWDGTLFLLRSKSVKMEKHNAYSTRDKSISNITRQVELKDSFVDGIFPGSAGKHYSSAMLEADHLVLRQKMEEVNGHQCYVVESRGKHGHWTVWIDPEAGYNLRKATIHVGERDSSQEKLSPDAIVIPTKSFDFVAQNIEVKSIDGVWLPVAGTVEQRTVYGDDKVSRWQRVASRGNIIWNPDFDKMGAFEMDLPEGNRIRNHDVPDKQFVWFDGKPQSLEQIDAKLEYREAPPLIVEKWHNGNFWQLDLKGKVVLLDFWGVWCRPCVAQIPFVKGLWERYSNQGLVVIGIRTSLQKEALEDFISKKDMPYLNTIDYQDQTAKEYNVFVRPTYVIVDRNSKICLVTHKKEQIEGTIISLLKTKPNKKERSN